MHPLNLGILAHVDAGRTSLTERLLHTDGVIDEVDSVDAGSTTTDTLALERRRGITIKSAVVSFPLDTVTVNLVDTPGHPDFIAEVERVLGVLHRAVLVVSAVEGVQAQTRVLTRTLRRLGKAVEDSVRESPGQGLHGWQVTDVAVTMTHAGYPLRQSHAHQSFDKSMSSTGHDVRGLTPLVLVEAPRRAGSRVYEPMHRFRVDAPADTLGALLPGLTRGEGEGESAFDHYAPVTGATPPERPRTDHNPLNREEYLLNVTRRTADRSRRE